ncbi:MAG: hypothetical protein KKH44_05815 [Bacteroidetes bacterium]|nr:hypothetical protein [Bacteroidota bacterium]
MTEKFTRINRVSLLIITFLVLIFPCCKTKSSIPGGNEKNIPIGVIESEILKMEDLIPSCLTDSNHVVIWRTGSDYYYSDYLSALIIEKNQLKDSQLKCHYMTFDPNKPSNYRNWKFANIYELTLENNPFKYPLNGKTNFTKIDSIIIDLGCHACIESNVYFMKDFKSIEVYPINQKHNPSHIQNIVKLFEQISKKEKVQTFSLTKDSIDYIELNRFCHEPEKSREYCIKENGDISDQQRHYDDK